MCNEVASAWHNLFIMKLCQANTTCPYVIFFLKLHYCDNFKMKLHQNDEKSKLSHLHDNTNYMKISKICVSNIVLLFLDR